MAINKYNAFKYFSRQQQTVMALIARNSSESSSNKVKDPFHPETILSPENRANCIARLQKCPVAIHSGETPRSAAVLVPLCINNNEMGLLYTLRSTKLSSNKGQVSFPGGMRDSSDNSFEETALRETWEELNIPKENVNIWSRANIIGRKHVHVMPVFGYIGNINPNELKYNPNEVEEAFVVTLRELCDNNNWGFTQFRNNYTLPTYFCGKHRIWGLTALITHIIMKSLVPDVYHHKLQFLQPIEHYVNKKI